MTSLVILAQIQLGHFFFFSCANFSWQWALNIRGQILSWCNSAWLQWNCTKSQWISVILCRLGERKCKTDVTYSTLGSQTALSCFLSSAVSFEPPLGVNGLLIWADLLTIILRKNVTTHTGWFWKRDAIQLKLCARVFMSSLMSKSEDILKHQEWKEPQCSTVWWP